MVKIKGFSLFMLLSIFAVSAFAEQVKTMTTETQPYISGYQPTEQLQQQLQEQQLQQQRPQLQQQPQQPIQQPQQPAMPHKLSDFERFLSGKIEITAAQLEALKKHGLSFSYTSAPASIGNVSVPVKIVKDLGKADLQSSPAEGEAGYLIGTSETITEAFKSLDIKSFFIISTDIRQFGYDLFGQPTSTIAPADKVPVGPDYVVGPGDEIKVGVWGKISGQWSAVVDRDGNIVLPKMGVIGVTGLTFSELKELLYKEFSKYYTGFEMNVSMGNLRTIKIYVVGNAERPGAYTVSALSTLVTALFDTGGPSKIGTIRDIQVNRNGKNVVHFDMYDFLLKGDKSKDVRLMPGDVVFIPPIGTLAAVAGNVHNPAIYELKDEKNVSQLIEMAGGLSVVAFKGRVQIERIVDNNRQVVSESSLEDIRSKDVPLYPGDVVKVFQVVEDKRTIRLAGAVQREGEYGFQSGMTFKDLILLAGGLRYYAYNKEAELTRVHITEKGPTTEKILINVGKAMAGEPDDNIKLQEDDYIFIRTIPEWRLYRTVSISGEVMFPGSYTIKKGERLSSLIERAGGFTDKAYLPGTAFTRESVRELQQKNLDDSIDRLEKQMMSQAAISAQTAFSPEEAQQQRAVAEQQKAIIAKMRAAKAQGRLVIKLDYLDKFKDSVYDVELEDKDSLIIPERPNSIQVIGSVYNSTAFIYEPNASISNFVDRAGGTTRYADEDDIFVLKVDGSAVARRQSGMFFMSSRLNPGDTIVVPEKVEQIAWMREVKDFTQILYQIAVAAAVVIKIF